MPTSPGSRCTTPGCGAIAPRGGRCPEHAAAAARASSRRRPSGGTQGWTVEWAAYRRTYLGMYPHCTSERCSQIPIYRRPAATEVDHIDGTGRTGLRAFDPSNLQALCKPCHSSKTASRDGGFGNPRRPATPESWPPPGGG